MTVFSNSVVPLPQPSSLSFIWITGSTVGEGALLTLTTYDPGPQTYSFYAAHIVLSQGTPQVIDFSPVVRGIPNVCGDLSGSSLGPDGKAYVMVYSQASNGPCNAQPGSLPLTVYIQSGGPTI